MAVANQPFYSTSYGESFGYNEREGNNLTHFRNRYLNDSYRGSPNLGPTRFATQAAQTLAATQQAPLASTQPFRPASQQSQMDSARYTASASQPIQQVYNERPQSYSAGNYSARVAPPYIPYQSQSYVDPSATLRPPYYIAPTADVPPSNPYSATFGSAGVVYESEKRPTSPAQSLPFGRLHASKRTDTYEPRSSQFIDREREPQFVRPGLTEAKRESMANYGKLSISRRLPAGERLRYHVPNYTGFVPTAQFRHGATFGQTTRKSLAELPY